MLLRVPVKVALRTALWERQPGVEGAAERAGRADAVRPAPEVNSGSGQQDFRVPLQISGPYDPGTSDTDLYF